MDKPKRGVENVTKNVTQLKTQLKQPSIL